jgi:hypothetical protein
MNNYRAEPAIRLLTVFHLRELFRRVRAGAPFDERNATTLHWLGLLLILIETMASAEDEHAHVV